MPLLNACHLGGKSTFQIQIEALADEKSQFRGLSCWGRELPSTTPDKGIGELTQLLTRWKLECLKVASVGKAVPPVLVGEGMRIAVSPQNGEFRVFEPDALPSKQPRAEVLQLVVGIQVFDDMRYGDVQSIVKACVDLKLMPYFMNSITCCPGCKVPSRVFTPVQLTMIYDSSGQLVGDQPILLAEKAGATGVQVVTENQIDTLLATFTARHWPKTPTIILTGEHEVSLDLLQTFNVRANRAGISVVRRSSFGEELSLSATDQLVPLMDEAPLPERGEIVDPSQNDAPRYDPSTDAPKESNGPFRGRSPTTEPDLTAPPSDDLTPPAGTFRGTQDLSPSGDSMPDADQIPINREGRVRVNPRPIPEESLVQEH